ncbi:hypothetical protein KC340_g1232 [Hortaea werneckii]|nr:hypothetical protein KC342_g2184 [Hortaea werneckii]KAI7337664.1 hypothetical protein KC340_g1232 [Hortaea werneckii]KAI7388885.1 hypothetical protein KC328_g8724 [Hortaea werneckii]
MADLTPHWVRILDEVDEATRHAIIETQLEGLDAPTDPGDPDTLLARDVFSIELKRYRGMRPYAPASEPAQSEIARDISGVATVQGKCMAHFSSEPSCANDETDGSSVSAQKRLERPFGREPTKRRLMEFWRWLTNWYTHASAQASQNFSRRRALKRSASPPAEEGNKRQKCLEHGEGETQPTIATPPIKCAGCGDEAEEGGGDKFCQVPCEHWYCDDCLQRLFNAILTDQSLFPPRCCQQPFEYAAIKPHLPEELAAQFEAKKEELGNKNRIYCSRPTCSAFIRMDHRDGRVAVCPDCKSETCMTCKGPMHEDECPVDEALESVLKVAEDEDWQRCPDCKGMIELTFGCNHMTCPCSAEFCYVCTESWKNCNCKLWFEERLIDRAQTVAARGFAGGDVQAAAQRLRNDITCDHERAYNTANWRRPGWLERRHAIKGVMVTRSIKHERPPSFGVEGSEFEKGVLPKALPPHSAPLATLNLNSKPKRKRKRKLELACPASSFVHIARAARNFGSLSVNHHNNTPHYTTLLCNLACDGPEHHSRLGWKAAPIPTMDVAYDHVQEESYSPANANDQSQKQADPSEPPQTLNTEFQQAFQAVSASPWGSKLGGWFNQARKQGEAYLTDLQKEAQDVQGQATQGWSKLQEEVTNRTRGLSLNAEPAPASSVPGEEAVPSIKTTEPEKEKQPAEHPEKPESLPADIVKEAGSLVASLRTTAAAKLKDLQKAEDAADEALLKFGSNVRNFLRDAVVITAPTDADSSKPKDPSQGAEWDEWTKNFDIDKQTEAIAQDLEKYEELRRAMEKLVPEKVEYKLFWTRYYFLRKAVEADERRRKEVLKGAAAQPEEEEVGWGSDNEDESTTPNPKSTKPTNDSSTTLNATAGSSSNDLLKPKEPRRSTDDKSVADSDASYDIVSGATSRAAGSPKEEKKEKSEESDDDWE